MLGSQWPIGEQYLPELLWFLDRICVHRCQSVLEIGSRNGYTLRWLAGACNSNKGKARAIDMASDANAQLRKTIEEMRGDGVDADCLIADSHSEEALKWATENGPYDVVFIDGDHTYAGVVADWHWYPGLAKKMYAFHDIAHPLFGVRRLWTELKMAGYPIEELVASSGLKSSDPMGIGIVHAWT